MSRDDPYNLQRFVDAQERSYDQACQELTAGSKQSHWMWFIFPQLRGLGHSSTAERYGISSLQETHAYLEHAILGGRLRRITEIVLRVQGRSIEEIFGYPDDLKFRSCMTLFAKAEGEGGVFQEALRKYFEDRPDPLTIQLLSGESGERERKL